MATRRLIAALTLATLLPLTSVTAAHAACSPPADLEDAVATAAIVFVGRTTDVATDRHSATVRVLSVWKGPDLEQTVAVTGGYEGDPDLRRYNEGAVYLFFPSNRRPPFIDDVCTATRLYSGPALVIPPYLTDEAGTSKARMPLGEAALEEAEATPITAIAIAVVLLLTLLGLITMYGRVVRVAPPKREPEEKPIFKPVRKRRRRQTRVRAYTATGSRAARKHAKPDAHPEPDSSH